MSSHAWPGLVALHRLALERAQTASQAVDVITSLLEAHGQGGPCEEGGDWCAGRVMLCTTAATTFTPCTWPVPTPQEQQRDEQPHWQGYPYEALQLDLSTDVCSSAG